jgi:hypothetical protein
MERVRKRKVHIFKDYWRWTWSVDELSKITLSRRCIIINVTIEEEAKTAILSAMLKCTKAWAEQKQSSKCF